MIRPTALAAIDRLVHHSIILELNVKSYRMQEAQQRRRKNTGQTIEKQT